MTYGLVGVDWNGLLGGSWQAPWGYGGMEIGTSSIGLKGLIFAAHRTYVKQFRAGQWQVEPIKTSRQLGTISDPQPTKPVE